MNKIFILSLTIITFSIFILKPAFADADILKQVGKTSLSTTSMATGAVLGTPIAVVRKTYSQYVDCLKEFKKDSNTYKFWGAGYSVPVAVVSGLIKGTTCGAKNAIRYSVNKPFSKDTFSLGNLEDGVPTNIKATHNIETNLDKPENQPWGTPR